MYCILFFFFFFSSRRRHTRYWRDWSSDVCSSDLFLVVPRDPCRRNPGTVRADRTRTGGGMESQGIDAVEFRDRQREQWNSAASGWRKWSELIDRAAGKVTARLVELAQVEPGDRVLDVAAGYGEPSLTAARVAGPDGGVVATDISRQMLAYGAERAAAAGVENIEFLESAAAAPEFPADSFDAALSRWGIIFEPDGEGAAARARGFLKPGARMGISSWGPPDRVPMLAVPM